MWADLIPSHAKRNQVLDLLKELRLPLEFRQMKPQDALLLEPELYIAELQKMEVQAKLQDAGNGSHLTGLSLDKLDAQFRIDVVKAIESFSKGKEIPFYVSDASKRSKNKQAENMTNLYKRDSSTKLANIYSGNPTTRKILEMVDKLVTDKRLTLRVSMSRLSELLDLKKGEPVDVWFETTSGSTNIQSYLHKIRRARTDKDKQLLIVQEMLVYMMDQPETFGTMSKHRTGQAMDISEFIDGIPQKGKHPYIDKLREHIDISFKYSLSTSTTEYYGHLHIQYNWYYNPDTKQYYSTKKGMWMDVRISGGKEVLQIPAK